MTRPLVFALFLFAACAFTNWSYAADLPKPTTQQIRAAVDKAKSYIYANQLDDKTWEGPYEGHGSQKTGQTALAVYALLSAGESRHDPRIAPAIEYLKKTDTTGVYALGLRCQVWLMLPPTPDVRQQMSKDARILLTSIKRTGEAAGFYDYNPGGSKNYSHSRAQYAVLGVWAAAQSGVEVPKEYWQLVEKAWLKDQDASGGWSYMAKPTSSYPVTAGMTAVGVATLYITQDYLHSADNISGSGNVRSPAIDRGTKWLADNFNLVAPDKDYTRALPFATLYSVERIAVAGGTKYFNGVDWYDKGAAWLIKQQKSSGGFSVEMEGKTASTCFALLFLTRGAEPVMMNKLDYTGATVTGGKKDDEPHWNQRPREVANVARWTGRQMERTLNWQVVTLDSPVADWHDAPILYLGGNQQFTLKPEHEAKIKQFVEEGGIVLGNADGASSNFSAAFKALGQKLFPPAEFQPLPENHVLFTAQQFPRSKWKRKPTVLALTNGARILMLLMPDSDPARAWQLQQPLGREELFELPADLFLYSVDKQYLRRRGETYLVTADEKIKATKTIKVARIQHGGNWDPEPGGWRRLSAVLHNANKIDATVDPVKPAAAGALDGYNLAHLTGTVVFKLEPAEREAIKAFVQRGGTLVVDAAGGSSEFAKAVETELAAMFPDAPAQLETPLSPDDPLFGAGATKLAAFDYRTYARTKLGQLKLPQLRGIRVNNRLAVVFSREDLTVGLVGQPVDGIIGYEPGTATAIMQRIVLSATAATSK
jgi:hypothetical protein